MDRFNFLLTRFLNNEASQEEYEELVTLIHDPANRAEVDKIVDEQFQKTRVTAEGPTEAEDQYIIESILKPAHKVSRVRTTWMMAAATFVVVSMVGVWIYRHNSIIEQPVAEIENVVTFKGKDLVHLPDGSSVHLNEGSELSYSFSENAREVHLTGEGYFDITHDPSRPFTVHTGKVKTSVLGTAFNIRAYPDQQEILVTVTRGKVKVGDDSLTYGIITPNEQMTVNKATLKFERQNLDAEESIEWTNKFLVFDHVSFESAAEIIEEKFGVKVILANDALKKCSVTAKFLNGESLEHVLIAINEVHGTTYRIEVDGSIIIDGVGCE